MKTKFIKPTIFVLFSILFYSCNTTVVNNKMDVAFEPLYSKKGEPTLVGDYLNLVRNNKLKNSSFSNERYSDSLLSSSANRLRPSPPY